MSSPFDALLTEPSSSWIHGVHGWLRDRFPTAAVCAADDDAFDVPRWASATGLATVSCPPDAVDLPQLFEVRGRGSVRQLVGQRRVTWRGQAIDLFRFEVSEPYRDRTWQLLVAPDLELARSLFEVVVRWNRQVHAEVLVFGAGAFHKDEALQAAIDRATFDDLVLPRGLADGLRDDVTRFLASREVYARAGAAWKRGILLLGPPGNGKTHALKALIRHAQLPCVYVKSFTGRRVDPADTIPCLFSRVRELSPCVLVLEDLDALIDDDNRSFILNELDGFAENHGLLTVATSNHPERLDPSLLYRPSRFDRKYRFALPDEALRRAYLERWASAQPTEVDASALTQATAATEGFTFAYLKELGLSAVTAFAAGDAQRLGDALVQVAGDLSKELSELAAAPPPKPRSSTPKAPWDDLW